MTNIASEGSSFVSSPGKVWIAEPSCRAAVRRSQCAVGAGEGVWRTLERLTRCLAFITSVRAVAMSVAHVLLHDARVAILCVCALPLSCTAGALIRAVAFVASVLALCETVALLDCVQTESVEGPALDGSRETHELVDAAAVVATVFVGAVLHTQ